MATTLLASTPRSSATMSPPPVRRSSTLPTMLNEGASLSNKEEEAFSSCSPVRIIKFTSRSVSYQPTSNREGSTQAEAGTLPWASRPEETEGYGKSLSADSARLQSLSVTIGICRIINKPYTYPFLYVGGFERSILPRTQCWCVDGVSKFVLPTPDGSYSRIELPTRTEEDKTKVQEFKNVLGTLLRYEKTSCPFKRGFEVELPPEPETPDRFALYKPRVSSIPDGGNGIARIPSSTPRRYNEPTKPSEEKVNEIEVEDTKASSETDLKESVKDDQSSLGLFTPEKSQSKPITVPKRPLEKNAAGRSNTTPVSPFDISETQSERNLEDEITLESFLHRTDDSQETESRIENDSSDEYMTARSHSSSLSSFQGPSESNATDDTISTQHHNSSLQKALNGDHLKTPTRSRSRSKTRAITAPPQLLLGHSQPSKAITTIPISSETSSLSSSSESFQSFHTTTSPLPPSPPDSNPSSPIIAGLDNDLLSVPRYRGHKRDVSDATITPDLANSWDAPRKPEDSDEEQVSNPSTPALVSDSGPHDGEPHEILTPPSVNLRRHRTSTQQRALSPLPLAANLYRPPPRLPGRHLTASIIQTTWAILNSPPSHLVQLMLTVARKIASGTLRGSFTGTAESGEQVTAQWEFTQREIDENADWEEDDYGVAIESPSRKTAARHRIKNA